MSFINGQSIIIGILWTMTELYNMFSRSILQFYHRLSIWIQISCKFQTVQSRSPYKFRGEIHLIRYIKGERHNCIVIMFKPDATFKPSLIALLSFMFYKAVCTALPWSPVSHAYEYSINKPILKSNEYGT